MYITYLIIAITVIVSIIAFEKPSIIAKYKFNAYMVYHKKEWYRIVTSGFLHADWNHLIFNMITLYFFGTSVESAYGHFFGDSSQLLFVVLYVGGLIVSSLYSLNKHKNNHWYSALGASGAVSAVLFTHILFNPYSIIIVFVIPMPAILFGIGYLVYSAYMSKKSTDNIGHDAHFWGAIFGFSFPIFINHELFFSFLNHLLFL